jgi:hypothetical protein
MRFIVKFSLVLTILIGFTSAQTALADACTLENLAKLQGNASAKMTQSEMRAAMKWCKRAQKEETLRAKKAGTAGKHTSLADPDADTKMQCGANKCRCWKGNFFDSCHMKFCKGPLKCIGKICACDAIDSKVAPGQVTPSDVKQVTPDVKAVPQQRLPAGARAVP